MAKFQEDPHWRDYLLFHEYFHGDNGAGLGASHQTGWTGLVAVILAFFGRNQIGAEWTKRAWFAQPRERMGATGPGWGEEIVALIRPTQAHGLARLAPSGESSETQHDSAPSPGDCGRIAITQRREPSCIKEGSISCLSEAPREWDRVHSSQHAAPRSVSWSAISILGRAERFGRECLTRPAIGMRTCSLFRRRDQYRVGSAAAAQRCLRPGGVRAVRGVGHVVFDHGRCADS